VAHLQRENDCHACRGQLPMSDDCPGCGTVATHTHHDHPDLTLECEVCGGPCTAPVPVYSCIKCGRQFVSGESLARA
jgi:hypothetical protein